MREQFTKRIMTEKNSLPKAGLSQSVSPFDKLRERIHARAVYKNNYDREEFLTKSWSFPICCSLRQAQGAYPCESSLEKVYSC